MSWWVTFTFATEIYDMNYSWIPWNLSFRYILFHEKITPDDAARPQLQSQLTPKMKANAVLHLLSSSVWIDQYNECNGMTSFMEFMSWVTFTIVLFKKSITNSITNSYLSLCWSMKPPSPPPLSLPLAKHRPGQEWTQCYSAISAIAAPAAAGWTCGSQGNFCVWSGLTPLFGQINF